MDWDKCVLCQTGSGNLLDPSENRCPELCGYTILAGKINGLISDGFGLPKSITISKETLEGETGIALNLKANKAKWHKNCALEVSASRLK